MDRRSFLLALLAASQACADPTPVPAFEPLRVLERDVHVAALSPSRKLLGMWNGEEIKIWQMLQERERGNWSPEGTPTWLAFSPDDQTVAMGVEEGRIEAWTARGERLWAEAGASAPGVVSHHGRWLVHRPKDGGPLTVRDMRSGQVRTSFKSGDVTGWTISQRNATVYMTTRSGSFQRFDMATGKRLSSWSVGGQAAAPVASVDGRYVGCRAGEVCLIMDASSGAVVRRFQRDRWECEPLRFSVDGDTVAIAEFGPTIGFALDVRDVGTGKRLLHKPLVDQPRVDFAPPGHAIATAGARVRVYRLVDADLKWLGPSQPARAAWFSRRDRIILWSFDGTVSEWAW